MVLKKISAAQSFDESDEIGLFSRSAEEMNDLFSEHVQRLRHRLEELVRTEIEPYSDETDGEGKWPERSMRALQREGFMGLHVPKELGGHGEGLQALTALCETIGKSCPSSAICFGMHNVGTAVMAAKATQYHREQYLKPIAEGRHITTLALSEAGAGIYLYLPQTELKRDGESYVVNGEKQFVTNGAHADSYVISTLASTRTAEAGEFSCLVVDRDLAGMEWGAPWNGFGMRGNDSRSLTLKNVRVPVGNLLGSEGEQIAYVFEVVAPYFLTAMAGTYLGVAGAALEIAQAHLKTRTYSFSGEALADAPLLQNKIAELWIAVQKSRLLAYEAARLGDLGNERALPFILSAKSDVAKTAVWVCNEAMTLCGGMAYRANGRLARLLRDARASEVMSPTTNTLNSWLGRALLELPLL